MDDITIARALHVLTIIHWIGGPAFVTLVVLPLARTRAPPFDRFLLFENVEKKFSAQVRLSVPLAGISGFWMVERMDLWRRFADLHYWWLTAMMALRFSCLSCSSSSRCSTGISSAGHAPTQRPLFA